MKLDALLGGDDGEGMHLSPGSAAGAAAANKTRAAGGAKKAKDKFAGLSVDEDVDFFSAFSVDQLQDDLSPAKGPPAPRKPLVSDEDGGDDLELGLADEASDPLLQLDQQQPPAAAKATAAAAAAADTAEPATAAPGTGGRMADALHAGNEGGAAQAGGDKSSPPAAGSMDITEAAPGGGVQAAQEAAATSLPDDPPVSTVRVQPASPARCGPGAAPSPAAAAEMPLPAAAATPAAAAVCSRTTTSTLLADQGPAAAVMQTRVPQDNSMAGDLTVTGAQGTTPGAAAPASDAAPGKEGARGSPQEGHNHMGSAAAPADHPVSMDVDAQDPPASKQSADATKAAQAAAGAPMFAASSSKAPQEPQGNPTPSSHVPAVSSGLAANIHAAPAAAKLSGGQARTLLDTAAAAAAGGGGGSGRRPAAAAVPKPVAPAWQQRPGLMAGAAFPSALRGMSKTAGPSFAAPKPSFFTAAKPNTAAQAAGSSGAAPSGSTVVGSQLLRPAAATGDLQSQAKKARTTTTAPAAAAAPAAGSSGAMPLLTPLRAPAPTDGPDASQQHTPGYSSTHGRLASGTPAAAVQDHLMSAAKSGAEGPAGAAAAAAAAAGRPAPLEEGADMEVDVPAAGAGAAAGLAEEGDVLQTTLAADFTDHIKRLEAMLLEAQGMQERVLELRVQAAITSNRLVRLNNPATARKLATLHAALQQS